MVFGWGLGTIHGPIAAIVAASVDRARSGVANSFLYICRPVGSALGIAGFGALLQAHIAVASSAPVHAAPTDVVASVAATLRERQRGSRPAARAAFSRMPTRRLLPGCDRSSSPCL